MSAIKRSGCGWRSGADRSRLVGWVAGRGLRLLGWGAGIGLIASWPLAALLAGVLFGVAPTDVPTAVGAVGLIVAVGSLAMLLPSLRATRVDPVVVLRHS